MSPPKRASINKAFRVPSESPPFTKGDLKAAIPPHCFQRSTFRSTVYLIADLIGVASLYFLSTLIPKYPSYFAIVLWPTYWILQGGVSTGLWVIAHECGHRAYSDSVFICDLVGWVLHSILMVPYHSWRISHGKHHRSTGNIERDEVFVPQKLSQLKGDISSAYTKPNSFVVSLRLIGTFLVGWYAYLIFNAGGRDYGSQTNHYLPGSPLFNKRQYWQVILSDAGIAFTLIGLGFWTYQSGFSTVVCVYGIPLLVVNFWLILYTYLHHTDPAVPHYRSEKWNWLQGALTTVDRDYGFFWNTLHHNIGNTHVCHHLFSKIPHYHAKEATEALKPILGKYYYENKKPVYAALWEAAHCCTVVDDSPTEESLWFITPTK